ncbi:MAG: TonB-dependent receptor [Sphingomonas bacterium]
MRNFNVRRLLCTTTIIAGFAAMPALAQTAQTTTASEDATPVSDIIVTGSRVTSPNLTATSPITAVNAEDIKVRGATRIEDVLNNLPQSFATQSSSVSNGSNGTATANLRNLGDTRTLVLVDGRRLTPGDPNTISSAADLNVIPGIMIKRVDVLTGGASTVYGADAVAGVVNFVLDNDFTGVSADANYGFYNHDNNNRRWQDLSRSSGYPSASGWTNDGQQFDASLKIGAGTDDGRGHIVAYFSYREIKAVQQGSRDFSSCGINADTDTNAYFCGGSSTAYPANFTMGDSLFPGTTTKTNLPQSYTLDSAGNLTTGRTLYNANPLNYYQRPDTRYVAGFSAHYDVSDAFKPYSQFMFMDDHSVAQIAPSGDFGNTTTINCNNPLLSTVQQSTFCRATNLVLGDNGQPLTLTNPDGSTYNLANVNIGRRNVEGGGRQADMRHTSYRIVIGAKGDIAKGISYDVYGQYGTTIFNEVYRNEFSISRTQKALDVIQTANGPACRSVVDGSDPNCVPLNIFGSAPITQQALNYVQVSGLMQGETREKIVSGSITFRGDEYGVKTPWAEEGVTLNIGAEYREEALKLEVDQEFASGDLAGQGGATLPIAGGYNVKDVFAEISIPIVTDKPFFHELSFNGGYRHSSYNISGGTNTYKLSGAWAPVPDIKFRGGYNRAVRSPNVQEMFVAQSVQIDGASDPCSGPNPGFTAAQCARTGVPTALYGAVLANPSEQMNGLIGGNMALKPETADTVTLGVLFQPRFLPGFNLSVDAFSIKVSDIIGQIGADTIVSQCALTGDSTLCGAIHRDANYTLWQTPNGYIDDLYVNAGTLKTRGLDIVGNYTYRTEGMGNFTLNFNGTYVDQFRFAKAGAAFDCAGLYGAQCGYPQSKWRHQLRLSWQGQSGIGISGAWRYLSGTTFERASQYSDLQGPYVTEDAHVGAQSYFDLALTARVQDKYTFRIGANNILDRDPPIMSATASPISSFGNGNTYPGIYDSLGRYIFVGLSIDM